MAAANPLAMFTHAQWLEKTKVSGLARRPSTLKKIDDLYRQAWTLLRAKNSQGAYHIVLRDMLAALELYLQEHNAKSDWTGKDGKDLNRNRLSGGLMKALHEYVISEVGPRKSVPVNDSRHSRAGVLYLLGHTQANINMFTVARNVVTVGFAAANVGTGYAQNTWDYQQVGKLKVKEPLGLIAQGSHLAVKVAEKAASGTATPPDVTLLDRCYAMVKRIAESLEKYFKMRTSSFYANLGKVLTAAAKFAAGQLTKAAPMIGAGIDIGQGFVKACVAVANYIGAKGERKQIELVPGHPTLLAQRIQNGMLHDITDGLVQIAKGAASATLSTFSAGIASAITDIVLTIVSFIRRYFEKCRIEEFCAKAHAHLSTLQMAGYKLGDANANIGKKFGLIDDVEAFTEFYSEGADASVCIPILTLNSGICGDLMQMARMYDTQNNVISQTTFNTATDYFQRLKLWGSNHIRNSGINFESNYRNVGDLIRHATSGHQGMQSTAGKIVSVIAAA